MEISPRLRAVVWPNSACARCARITVRSGACDHHCDGQFIVTVESLRAYLTIARAAEKINAPPPPINEQGARVRAAWERWRERNGRPRKTG